LLQQISVGVALIIGFMAERILFSNEVGMVFGG